MKRFATEAVVVLSMLIALNGRAQTFSGTLGYAPNSPMVFGHAPVRNLPLIGVDVAFGKGAVEYVSTFTYIYSPHTDNYGLQPIGFRFHPWKKHSIHPFLLTNEGIIASTRPIPVPHPNATGLNFLVDFGGGVQLGRTRIGYKFLHVSNAGTTRFNPGLDANVVFLSWRIN